MPFTFRTRARGAGNNAGLSEIAAQAEDCDWDDGGGRCNRSRRVVLAAGGFGGFATSAIEPTPHRTAEENARSGAVASDRSEDFAGQGTNRWILQRALCGK